MVPFILVGAGVGLAAIYKMKSTCSICDSKLTWNEDCLFDGKPVCADCGKDMKPVIYLGEIISLGGRCCKAHLASYENQITEEKAAVAKKAWARAESDKVKTWTKTYEGNVPPPRLGKLVSTDEYADKDEALTQLKMLAVLNGCSHVQEVEFIKGTGQEGNFKFAVWRTIGII